MLADFNELLINILLLTLILIFLIRHGIPAPHDSSDIEYKGDSGDRILDKISIFRKF